MDFVRMKEQTRDRIFQGMVNERKEEIVEESNLTREMKNWKKE